jgi:hypothetical protein
VSETGKPEELPLVNDLPTPGTTPAGEVEATAKAAEPEKPKEGEAPAPVKDILDDETEAKPAAEKAPPLDLKIPEGVKLDETSLNAYKEKVSAKGIEPEVAQELLDMHLAAIDQTRKGLSDSFEAIQQHWMSEIKADKEVGGDRLGESKAVVAMLLREHGSPEAREALKLTGATNNPAIFKLLVNVGKALSEGKAVPGGKPNVGGNSGDLAKAMYPDLP